jgi:hypothetical protein
MSIYSFLNKQGKIMEMKKLTFGAMTGIGVGVGVAVGVALDDYAVGFGIGIAIVIVMKFCPKFINK